MTNFREAGLLVANDGGPLFWHFMNSTGGSIPDSKILWDKIWNLRDIVQGFAHTHPGTGVPGPSFEDITTFSAVELALGRRLSWWIATDSHLSLVKWIGPHKYTYWVEVVSGEDPSWLKNLRQLSIDPEAEDPR